MTCYHRPSELDQPHLLAADPGFVPAVVHLRAERLGCGLHPADFWTLVVRRPCCCICGTKNMCMAFESLSTMSSYETAAGLILQWCPQVAICCEPRRTCVSSPPVQMPRQPVPCLPRCKWECQGIADIADDHACLRRCYSLFYRIPVQHSQQMQLVSVGLTIWRCACGGLLGAINSQACQVMRRPSCTIQLVHTSHPCAHRLPKVVAVYGALPGWDATTCAVWGVVVILFGLVVPEVLVFRAERSERRRFLCELSSTRTPRASASCKSHA